MLCGWTKRRGWAAVMESMQRGPHHSSTESEDGESALAALDSLSHLLSRLGANGDVALRQHTSLFSTLRKLLWQITNRETGEDGACTSMLRGALPFGWALMQRKTFLALEGPAVIKHMLDAVSSLDLFLVGRSSSSSSRCV